MLQTLIDAAMPHLLSLAGALVSLAIAWVAKRISDWTGIEIEARHRAALHSAIMTGLRHAADGGRVTDRAQVAREAVEYAQRSVPDAIRGLGARGDVLLDLAESRLGEVLGKR